MVPVSLMILCPVAFNIATILIMKPCLNPQVREDENREIRGMYQEIYKLLISTYKKVSFIYIKENSI